MAQPFDYNKRNIARTQDSLGYQDMSLFRKQNKVLRVPPPYNFASLTNNDLLTVEPTPTRPVRLAQDDQQKKASKALPPKPDNAPEPTSSNSVTQPPAKFNPADTTAATAATETASNTLPPTEQPQSPPAGSSSNRNSTIKGKEREHSLPATEAVVPTASTSTEIPASSAATGNNNSSSGSVGPRAHPQTSQKRDEIRERFVSKFLELKELAEMLQYFEEASSPEPAHDLHSSSSSHRRSYEQAPPRPTPSHSDPNSHSPHLRRKASKSKMNDYAYPSPENNRKFYNKSADMAVNYGEPNQRHASGSRKRRSTDGPVDHYDGRTPYDATMYDYGHPYVQQIPYYYNYYLPPNEEPFLDHEDYYTAHHNYHQHWLHPLDQQRYHEDASRLRRKSLNNMHEEQQYRVKRKGSRGSMKKSKMRQQQQQQQQYPFYEYSDIPPPYTMPHQHHYQYPYGHSPYYQNQPYTPNGGS